ncbi:MAG: 50S ribosomal protein L11 methyltransferase [Clostridia bacterium]|nr:50S ribosomal protein L11 methyltransferase [Clostridia bacterium]
MQWIEIEVLTSREAAEAASVIFERYGATGFVIQDSSDLQRSWESRYGEIYELNPADYPETGVRLKAYLPVAAWGKGMLGQLAAEFKGLIKFGLDPGPARVEARIINEEDWNDNWKKYYHPVKVSERLTVKPSWEDYTPEDGEIVIALDPGQAFGTGTHPTTALCLQALEQLVKPGATVADVGCGTAILAIACAKLGAGSVLALDLDPLAVQVARKNIELNGVSDRISVRVNDLLAGIEEKFDLVVANILAEIVVKVIKDARRVLKPGGNIIVSGFTRGREGQVCQELQDNGFKIVSADSSKDWLVLVAESLV